MELSSRFGIIYILYNKVVKLPSDHNLIILWCLLLNVFSLTITISKTLEKEILSIPKTILLKNLKSPAGYPKDLPFTLKKDFKSGHK